MKSIFFTPGPSQLYPSVIDDFQTALINNIGSISHRGEQFQELFYSTQKSLRSLMNIPSSTHIFFLASSLESMERIIQNCVKQYSFHLINGAFSKTFFTIAQESGKYAERIISKDGHGFHPDRISVPIKSELICVTQNETSTGVQIPVRYIHELQSRYPKKLIAVDIVSSAPDPDLDFTKIDLAFFSVQKGFGLPAGMSVLLVNEKALEKARFLKNNDIPIGSFHNFLSLAEKGKKGQTPETPNAVLLYLLGKVCEKMLKKGIVQIRKETKEKAQFVYDFFDSHELFCPFVSDQEFRSRTSITVTTGARTSELRKKLAKRGCIVGSGYGEFKESQIRIANFPAHTKADFLHLIKSIYATATE